VLTNWPAQGLPLVWKEPVVLATRHSLWLMVGLTRLNSDVHRKLLPRTT
jgi:hypothetical protein